MSMRVATDKFIQV